MPSLFLLNLKEEVPNQRLTNEHPPNGDKLSNRNTRKKPPNQRLTNEHPPNSKDVLISPNDCACALSQVLLTPGEPRHYDDDYRGRASPFRAPRMELAILNDNISSRSVVVVLLPYPYHLASHFSKCQLSFITRLGSLSRGSADRPSE
ncbi:hypothetical protein Bbelb_265630 [Branchiostoma belcheri]|nr:hypothetical protein Bbelb_265630 [Branchiostoma belcheri]